MYKIYKITNRTNMNIYIGSTKETLEKRFRQHVANSKLKKAPILEAIKEFGEKNFYIELIDNALTKEDSKIKETKYIKELSEKGFTLYNIHKNSNISSTFYSYDLITNEVKKYDSMKLLKKHMPAKVSCVLNQTKDKNGYERITCDNKLWSYENNENNWNRLIEKNKNKSNMPNKRKVENVITGEIFNSCREAAKSCGLKNSVSISEACSGRKKTAGGFVWKYI